ncbi:MAG: hypothetical protein J3Q66DRAFT_405580 [Benniella sp.]|nr:MAG: hypothetical protein J3Q66DRAFT_405580 [Benniella sp.]
MATVDHELSDFYQRLVHHPVSDCHDFDGLVWVLLITPERLLQDKFGPWFMNHIALLYHLLSESPVSGNLMHIRDGPATYHGSHHLIYNHLLQPLLQEMKLLRIKEKAYGDRISAQDFLELVFTIHNDLRFAGSELAVRLKQALFAFHPGYIRFVLKCLENGSRKPLLSS